MLEQVEARQGANPETCGLIGRIHKDYWTEALQAGNDFEARGHLNNAIFACSISVFLVFARDSTLHLSVSSCRFAFSARRQ